MVSITLSVSDKLKGRMQKHREIKWSEVARNSIEQKLDLLERMDKLLENSTLTEKDALRLGRKVNKAVAEKFYS